MWIGIVRLIVGIGIVRWQGRCRYIMSAQNEADGLDEVFWRCYNEKKEKNE